MRVILTIETENTSKTPENGGTWAPRMKIHAESGDDTPVAEVKVGEVTWSRGAAPTFCVKGIEVLVKLEGEHTHVQSE